MSAWSKLVILGLKNKTEGFEGPFQESGHVMRILFWVWAACVATVLTVYPVSAQQIMPTTPAAPQEEVVVPDNLTEESVRALMAELSDEEVRSLLLEQLDAVAAQHAAGSEPQSIIDRAVTLWTAFTTPARLAISRIGIIPETVSGAIATFVETQGGASGVMTMFGLVAAILAAAYGLELLARRLIVLPEVEAVSQEAGLLPALRYLARRFFREMLGLIVFLRIAAHHRDIRPHTYAAVFCRAHGRLPDLVPTSCRGIFTVPFGAESPKLAPGQRR